MKNKAFFALATVLLATCILLSLSACGKNDESSPVASSAEASANVGTSTDNTEEADIGEIEQETAAAEVAWLECTDNETLAGYSLRKELKISQWISENDSELLSSAWNEVSKGNAFPSLQSLGFSENSLVASFGKTVFNYDEIYYAVGSLDVWNETDGWDITKDNTLDISIYLYGANRYMTMTLLYSNASKNHYSVANGVFGTQGGGWSPITGKMQSNHWGSVPFVIAFAIDRTPEHPDGDPSIFDCTFRFGDSTFTLVPSADDGE